jgi:hypothetical protein
MSPFKGVVWVVIEAEAVGAGEGVAGLSNVVSAQGYGGEARHIRRVADVPFFVGHS